VRTALTSPPPALHPPPHLPSIFRRHVLDTSLSINEVYRPAAYATIAGASVFHFSTPRMLNLAVVSPPCSHQPFGTALPRPLLINLLAQTGTVQELPLSVPTPEVTPAQYVAPPESTTISLATHPSTSLSHAHGCRLASATRRCRQATPTRPGGCVRPPPPTPCIQPVSPHLSSRLADKTGPIAAVLLSARIG
jgi:hypothetical protein